MAPKKSRSRNPSGQPTGDDSGDVVNDRPRTFSAVELMAMEFPDVQWLIEDVLPEGLAVIAGKPKIGKSWWTLALALEVAREAPVLYLALEDTDRRLQSRFRALLNEDPPPEQLTFHLDWPRLDRGGNDAIEEWLAANPAARLIVVDTIARVRPPRKGNEDQYLGDVETWGPFQQLVGRHAGLTLIGVHHQRKGSAEDVVDTVLGSQGLVGSVDTVMVLSRGRSKADGELFITGRDIEETERALTFDRGHWLDIGPLEEHKVNSERSATLSAMHEIGPCKPSELAAELDISTDAAKKRLYRMKHAGLVQLDHESHEWLVAAHDDETWETIGR
jgi:hypothetical protein